MKGLTPHQQRIFDLAQTKTNAEIASELGVSVPNISKTLVVCNRKLGFPMKPGVRSGRANEVETKNPELAAAAIEAASAAGIGTLTTQKAAIEAVNEQLRAAGIPGKVSEAVVRRMLVKHADVVTLKKKINTNEILDRLDDDIYLIGSYIDDKVAAEASLRDLAQAKAILIDKRQLLRGEPTAIVSDYERKKIHELLPALVAEAKRRSITIDVTPQRIDDAPAS